MNVRRTEGSPADVKDGVGHRGLFSPQDSPCKPPRSPHSPRSPCLATGPAPVLPTRSHSDSEAVLGEQGAVVRLKGPTENLFLDALSLDLLSGDLEVPLPSRLESEKRFPCVKEVRLGLLHCWTAGRIVQRLAVMVFVFDPLSRPLMRYQTWRLSLPLRRKI